MILTELVPIVVNNPQPQAPLDYMNDKRLIARRKFCIKCKRQMTKCDDGCSNDKFLWWFNLKKCKPYVTTRHRSFLSHSKILDFRGCGKNGYSIRSHSMSKIVSICNLASQELIAYEPKLRSHGFSHVYILILILKSSSSKRLNKGQGC